MSENDTSIGDIHALTGAYVVDALDPDERTAFDAHLRDCAECQLEVRELSEAATRYGSAEAVAAPTSLRATVLAQVANTPQVVPTTSDTNVVSIRSKKSRSLPWLAAAASVLAIAAVSLAGVTIYQTNRVDQISAQATMVTQVLTSPDAHMAPMPMVGSGQATVVMSPSSGNAVLVANNMSAAPSHMTYQSWMVDANGHMSSAGTWNPGTNGSAAVPLHGQMTGATEVMVTMEPMPGSAQPTSQPVAIAKL